MEQTCETKFSLTTHVLSCTMRQLPDLCLAICTRVSKVGYDAGDGARGRPLAGVHHDEQLHEVVVDGGAGGLHQEHIAATDRLLRRRQVYAGMGYERQGPRMRRR